MEKYPIEPSGIMEKISKHFRGNFYKYLIILGVGAVAADSVGPSKISYMDLDGERIRVEETFVFSSPLIYVEKNGTYKKLSTIHEEEALALKRRHRQEERALKRENIEQRRMLGQKQREKELAYKDSFRKYSSLPGR